MTKKITTILALCIFLGSGQTICADDTEGATNVTIEITDGEVVPPGDDGSSTGPGGTSSFQIWKFPIIFGFKSVSYNNKLDMVARIDTGENNNPDTKALAVADMRSGANGWRLSASLPKLEDIEGIEADITNVELSFKHEIGSWDIDSSDAYNHEWIAGGVDTDIDSGRSIIKNTPSIIISARRGHGMGYQGTMMNDIRLTIKAGQGKEGVSYKGTIYWSLDDTPGS